MTRPLFDSPAPERPSPHPVWLRYGREEELTRDRDGILGVIRFGEGRAALELTAPMLDLPLTPLDESDTEVWRSQAPVTSGRRGPIHFASNGEVLFATLAIGELEGLEAASLRAYDELLELLEELGYPHLLRAWNYLGAINQEETGLERYRRFCVGRHDGLARHRLAFDRELPAASAVGYQGRGLSVVALASRAPGAQLENPRQVAAWSYPSRYGPRSPSFARATLKCWGSEWQLYVAGTASIVGHESRHPGNAEAQLEETLRNLEAVEREARAMIAAQGDEAMAADSRLRIYVRERADAGAVATLARSRFGAGTEILVLEADICRRELLVEIELLRRYVATR